MKRSPLLVLILVFLSYQQAFAYIDPGSGSALMSAIIGFFVAIGVVIKTYWYKITGLLSKITSKNAEAKKNNKT